MSRTLQIIAISKLKRRTAFRNLAVHGSLVIR